jgi:autotransporter-associated beta strand protein
VTVVQTGDTIDVQLGAAGDAALVAGEDATGKMIAVTGTGFATTVYTGITSVSVTDTAPGGGANQQATVQTGLTPGATFNLPGALTVTGVEAVNVASAVAAAGGVTVSQATTINLTAGSLDAGAAAISLATTPAGQIATDAAGSDLQTTGAVALSTGFVGTAAAPLRVSAGSLSADTSTANGGQFYVVTGGTDATGLNAGTGTIDLGGGTFRLTNGTGIGDASRLTLEAGTTLDMNGTTEALDRLTGTGTVTSAAAAVLTVGSSNGSGTFDGPVGGPVQLIKTGTGTLTLTGTNTYTGGTTLRQGVLDWSSAGAFGSGTVQLGDALSPAGTSPFLLGAAAAVLPNDILVKLPSSVVGSDPAAAGPVGYSGTVTLAVPGGAAFLRAGSPGGTTFTGRVTGTGDLAVWSPDAPGRVIILANQTTTGSDFAGTSGPANVFIFPDAVLQLDVVGSTDRQLPTNADVVFQTATSVLQLAAPAGGTAIGETVGGLISQVAGAGQIRIADATAINLGFGQNAQSTSYTGNVTDGTGTLSLTKVGAGTTVLGPVTVSGSVSVVTGLLQLAAPVTAGGTVTVFGPGGAVGGVGPVTGTTVVQGGEVRPGDITTPGVLTTGDIGFAAGSRLTIRINGSAAGTDYDQLKVNGTVDLGTAADLVPVPLAGLTLPVGTVLTVIDNDGSDPVTGTFHNMPEGASFTVGGLAYQISYVGGDGNDVTLTRVAVADQTPPTTTLNTPGFSGNTPPNPYSFTVTYTDPSGVNASTIGANNLVITRNTGFSTEPAFVSSAPVQNGFAVVYQFGAPGGNWDVSDNGTFTVAVGTNPVADTVGNALPSGFSIGTITVAIPPPPGPTGSRPLAVGGPTDGTAVVYGPTGSGTYTAAPAAKLAPFGLIAANARTAVADVNGDGIPDTILVTGPGVPVRFAVVDGKDNSTLLVPPTDPFGNPSFTAGGFVAAGDINGDGRAEFVFTPDQGGGPNVVVYNLTAAGALGTPQAFFALGNPAFRGGARPAIGDVNGDGFADLAVAAGFLGGPNVEVHDGKALSGGDLATLVGGNGFFAFPVDAATLRNGVFLAVGDVDGDGFGDLIFGGGPGGGPRVVVYSGKLVTDRDLTGANGRPLANFFFGDPAGRGGVRVAAKDVDGDNQTDIVVGSGEGVASRVRVYAGKTVQSAGEPPALQDLDPFGQTLPGGVFVG